MSVDVPPPDHVLSAVEAARSRTNLLSMIAHELRSPLNSINGYLELTLAGAGGELNAQQHEFVQRARAASEHLYTLLEDLLLMARADAGQLQLKREIINLQDAVEAAVEELEFTAADYKIAVDVHIAHKLPRIYADTVRLRHALRDLLENALRFSQEGSRVTITAVVYAGDQSDPGPATAASDDDEMRMIKLQVRDEGVGIAAEYQERIFERFFQAPNDTLGRASGQGLGLAVVKTIVELHGGTVMVESRPEQGSTFTCMLPCLLT